VTTLLLLLLLCYSRVPLHHPRTFIFIGSAINRKHNKIAHPLDERPMLRRIVRLLNFDRKHSSLLSATSKKAKGGSQFRHKSSQMGNTRNASVLHSVVRHSRDGVHGPITERQHNADHEAIEGTRTTPQGLLCFPSSSSGMHMELQGGVVRPFWDSCALML
jgi:hypothetical protein